MKKLLFIIFLAILSFSSSISIIKNISKTTKQILLSHSSLENNETNLEEITLQPQWMEQFQFAGYYMAQKNGYYKDKNLKLTILPYKKNINITQEVLNIYHLDKEKQKKAPIYGIGNSPLILDIIKNKNIVLLKAILQDSPLIILSLQRNKLTPNIDKRIMLSKSANENVVFRTILNNENVQLNQEVHPIYQAGTIKDLINNKTDFIVAYKSNEPYILKEKKIDYRIYESSNLGRHFYSNILFTSRKEVEDNPQRVKAFTEATIKGWEDAFRDIKQTAKFIFMNHNEQNKSIEALIFEGKVLKVLAENHTSNLGEIKATELKKIEEYYKDRGLTHEYKKITSYGYFVQEPWYVKLKVYIEKYKFQIIGSIILLLLFMGYLNYLLNKRVEEELVKRKKQEKLTKQRNNLLIKADKQIKMETYIAHASHQLKSPLSTITSIINNTRRSLNLNNPNKNLVDKELLKIEKQSLMMKETINFFLKYLSNEHEKKYFSINQAINETVNYIDDFLKKDNVQVIFNYEEDFNCLGYEIQLIQVFQTIFENSIQALCYKKDNRIISITIDADEKDFIIILIADNGKGIPKKYLKKIFDPYFSTKKNAQVKGLGLNIAKIIIEENLKGTITAYNNNGAVFKIVLPPQ